MGLRHWIQKLFRTDPKKLEDQEQGREEALRAQKDIQLEKYKSEAETRTYVPPM